MHNQLKLVVNKIKECSSFIYFDALNLSFLAYIRAIFRPQGAILYGLTTKGKKDKMQYNVSDYA